MMTQKTGSQEPNHLVREKRKQDVLDEELSLAVAFIIGADPNACFDNVLAMFLTYFPEVFSVQGKLIEGWYVVEEEEEVTVNEHCWCELPNGRILDPTVVRLVPPERPVHYFAGVERCWQEVKDIVLQKDAYFPYVRSVGIYGEDGLGHPVYKAAHDAAVQKVFALANATVPPKTMTFLSAYDLQDQGTGGFSVQVFVVSAHPEEEEHR